MGNDIKIRKSNFELMRIFAIILILLNHYVVFGLEKITLPCSNLYMLLSHFIGGFGKLGVMLFIMITGYFMINTHSINFKHIIKIVLDTLFYSWFFLLIFLFIFPNYTTLSSYNIYKAIFPISTGWVWFISTYLILYILIPVLNYIFNSLSQKKITFYLLFFYVLWYIIPTFSYRVHFCFSEFVGFIYLYSLGAYIKKYGIKFFANARNNIIVIILSCFSIIGYLTVCNYLHLYNHKFWLHFSGEQSIFSLLMAISIFYSFKMFNVEYNKFINILASSTLSVYLIHVYMRRELWTKIFHCCASSSISYLILNISIMIISVYTFSTIFDKLKNKLFMNKINEMIADSKLVKFIDENYLNEISLKTLFAVERVIFLPVPSIKNAMMIAS